MVECLSKKGFFIGYSLFPIALFIETFGLNTREDWWIWPFKLWALFSAFTLFCFLWKVFQRELKRRAKIEQMKLIALYGIFSLLIAPIHFFHQTAPDQKSANE